jgi:hypothetical protein
MTCHLGPDATINQEEQRQESLGRQPSRSFIEANLSPEQGKHQSIPLAVRVFAL